MPGVSGYVIKHIFVASDYLIAVKTDTKRFSFLLNVFVKASVTLTWLKIFFSFKRDCQSKCYFNLANDIVEYREDFAFDNLNRIKRRR